MKLKIIIPLLTLLFAVGFFLWYEYQNIQTRFFLKLAMSRK